MKKSISWRIFRKRLHQTCIGVAFIIELLEGKVRSHLLQKYQQMLDFLPNQLILYCFACGKQQYLLTKIAFKLRKHACGNLHKVGLVADAVQTVSQWRDAAALGNPDHGFFFSLSCNADAAFQAFSLRLNLILDAECFVCVGKGGKPC